MALNLQAIIRKKFYYRKDNPAKIAKNSLERDFLAILNHLIKINSYDNLILEISEYIDYYNNKRIQKKLNGLSPIEYRTKTA